MKRYKYVPGKPGVTLFDAVCDINNLRLAHTNASKGKHWYSEVKMMNEDPDKYLYNIQHMLQTHTYCNSKYIVFNRQENEKIRTIYKLPYYPDRIIQWALLQVISPIIEKTFTKDTYSAIPGRGPIKCMLQLSDDVRNDPDNTLFSYAIRSISLSLGIL